MLIKKILGLSILLLVACADNDNKPLVSPSVQLSFNLYANERQYSKSLLPLDGHGVQQNVPESFHYKSDFNYQDEGGNVHYAEIYFKKVYEENEKLSKWYAVLLVDGIEVIPVKNIDNFDIANYHYYPTHVNLRFDNQGKLDSVNTGDRAIVGSLKPGVPENSQITYAMLNYRYGDDISSLTVDFSGSTQYGADYVALQGEKVDTYFKAPSVTKSVELDLRLSKNVFLYTDKDDFDQTDPSTFTHITATSVYDSLGVDHVLQLYFRKMAGSDYSRWQLYPFFSGQQLLINDSEYFVELVFESGESPAILMINNNLVEESRITLRLEDPWIESMDFAFALDVSKIREHDADFEINSFTQDGLAAHIERGN